MKGFAAKGYGLEGCSRTVETAADNLIFFVGSVVSRMDLELLRMRFKGNRCGREDVFLYRAHDYAPITRSLCFA